MNNLQIRPAKEFEVKFNLRTTPVENALMPAKEAVASLHANLKVNTYTEFDPLKGVIVGWIN